MKEPVITWREVWMERSLKWLSGHYWDCKFGADGKIVEWSRGERL